MRMLFHIKGLWTMKTFLIACVAVTGVSAQEGGYHLNVGIPLALRIYKSETTVAPGHSKVKSPASLSAHPYLAGVVVEVENAFSICGSSILTNTRAISAGHCWWDGTNQAKSFTMVFGSEFVFVGGIRTQTTDVKLHPNWDRSIYYNDLALIGFEYVTFNDFIQPIALPYEYQSYDFIGHLAQASGYGTLGPPNKTGEKQDQRQIDVPQQVVNTTNCIKASEEIMEQFLCSATKNQTSECISHSGGPLTTVYNNQRYLIGVAIVGDYECKSAHLYGFARITAYLQWIQSQL